jgi:hypothetical protein
MRNFLWMLFFTPLMGKAQAKNTTNTPSTIRMGHSIHITMKPYQNTKIFIGTNYGKNKTLADSCLLNEKGEGVFESKQKLTPGIYFIVSPKYSILFDFLIEFKAIVCFFIGFSKSRIFVLFSSGFSTLCILIFNMNWLL